MDDEEAINLIAEGLRTPEWSVSFLEDIADIVKQVRNIERENYASRGEADWKPH